MFFKKKKYYTINLFKVSDIQESINFDFKNYSLKCISYFSEIEYLKISEIEVNYGYKSWKTLSGYIKGVAKIANKDLTCLMAYNKDNSLIIDISNSLMNLDYPPTYGLIDLQVAISEEFYKEKDFINFINEYSEILNFDYGYIIKSNKSGLFNEGNKKSIFRNKSYNLPNFRFYSIGVKEGFIKKLYKLNILNDSHVEQPIIKQLIAEGIGDLEKLNNDIFIWRLNDQDFKVANDKLNNSKYVIFNEDNPDLFLQTEEAKRFNDLMKLR